MSPSDSRISAPPATTLDDARVLIVDDHELVREGFADLIEREKGLQVVAQASCGRDALALIEQHHPDVALIDFSLPDMSGLELIRAIRQRDRHVRMIVVSMHEESVYAERVIDAGAMGYVNKEDCIQLLVEAIRRVMAGKLHLSERLTMRFEQRGAVNPNGNGQPNGRH